MRCCRTGVFAALLAAALSCQTPAGQPDQWAINALSVSDSLQAWDQTAAAMDTLERALKQVRGGQMEFLILNQWVRLAIAMKDKARAGAGWQRLKSVPECEALASCAITEGALHLLQDQPELAEAAFRRALEKQAPAEAGERARAWNHLGVLFHQSQPDSALAFYRRALEDETLYEDRCALLEARIQNNLASLLLQRRDLLAAEAGYLAARQRLTDAFSPHFPYLLRTRLFLGYVWFELGRYDDAIYELQEALNGYLARPETNERDLAGCYVRLAAAWDAKGDLQKGLDFHNEAVAAYRRLSDSDARNSLRLAEALNNRGLTLFTLKQYAASLEDILASRALYYAAGMAEAPVMATLLTNLAHISMEAGERDSATVYFAQTEALIHRLAAKGVAPGALPTYFHYATQGDWYAREGAHEAARKAHAKALKEAGLRFGAQSGRAAKAAMALAKDEFALGRRTEALDRVTAAARALAADSLAIDPWGNPVAARAISPEVLLDLLWHKARWERVAAPGNEPERLRRAVASFRKAVNLSDSLELGIGTEGAKYYWLDRSGAWIHEAFVAAARLFALTHDRDDWEAAFHFAEKSKAALLREAWQVAEARDFSGIPPELLRKESRLRSMVSFLEREMLEAKPEQRQALATRLFSARILYDSLIQVFERSYPAYHGLKYRISNPDWSDVADIVSGDGAVLHYVVCDSGIYLAGASAREVFVKKLPLTVSSADSLVRLWRAKMQPDVRPDSALAAISFQLYQGLIAPVATVLPSRLYISPEGSLGLIPFEALLTDIPPEGAGPESWPYLLRTSEVSYVFSVSLLKEMRAADTWRQVSGSMLAVAPVFGLGKLGDSDKEGPYLSPLVFNQEEARTVSQLFPGRLLLGPDAQKARFLAEAPRYGLIHISSHGVLNDRDSRLSFIAFSRSETDSAYGKLFLSDLYSLRIPAQVVVLSACETGVGEWKRGEGVISLARGFSFAGARSIVTTLWEVNDYITARLMERFYQELKKGAPKDLALKRAKLALADEGWGPYQWAAPILVGDTAPIQRPRFWPWVVLATAGWLAVALGWWWKRSRQGW